MFRHGVAAFGLAAAVATLSAGSALGDPGGQGTVTSTTHDHDVVFFTDHLTNPCSGAPGTFTLTARNEIFHVTSFTNDDASRVTGTAEGTATFTPDDPGGVSASGHFADWFGESFNDRNDVQHFTITVNLKGSDGSHIVDHETAHLSTNAAGVVTVEFDRDTLTCGA